MTAPAVLAKNWKKAGWRKAADGYYRSDDPYGTYGGYTPTLPAATVTTTYSLPTGNTWTATNTSNSSVAGTGTGNRTDCSFTYALANCARNDVIVLTAGSSYVGPFTIPNIASGSGWVYVISSALASLPAFGSAWSNRIGYTNAIATDAANMPKITIVAGAGSALNTTNASHHFRFVGIEVKPATDSDFVYTLVNIGNNDVSDSTVPDNIIFDRCYVHGRTHATAAGRRGFALSGTNIAVINSYVSGFYEAGADSQAIYVYQGNGPFRVANNYLEAASENLLFGGTDPTITNSVPSDIEVVHNHMFKPTAWAPPANLVVKNLLEFKNAQRALVEGNILENNWADAQNGCSILITPRNQSNTAPWCVTKDLTIRKNKLINCDQGISISGRDSNYTTGVTVRVLIENNLMNVTAEYSGQGRLFQITNGPQYLTIKHNTAFTPITGNSAIGVSDNSPKGLNFIFKDNMVACGRLGWSGTATGEGTDSLTTWYTNYTFTYNAIIGTLFSGNYPSGNLFPANNAAVGFTDISGAFAVNNYTLTGGSAYHNAASDGTDIGCDIAALNAAIA